MRQIIALLAGLVLSAPAHAQATVLYPGQIDLPVRAGDMVVADCLSLIEPNPDEAALDTTGLSCIRPGPEGMTASMRHYMGALATAGFARKPSNMQTPVFVFCRGQEIVNLFNIRPRFMMNENLDYIDETGKIVEFEDIMAKAPIGLAYDADGPCSYF